MELYGSRDCRPDRSFLFLRHDLHQRRLEALHVLC
jgi:hypothetical protein